jgi:hypothetical protein
MILRSLSGRALLAQGAFVVASLLSVQPARAADWESHSEKDGVHLFTRDVEGSKIREVMAQGVVAARPEAVLAVLGDVTSYPEVMPPTEAATLLSKVGATAIYYMVINPGWIARRDYCIRATLSRLPEGKYKSQWTVAREGCPPVRGNVVRMNENTGQWLLSPIDGGRSTLVVYQADSDPAGAVPAWMVNSGTIGGLRDLFRSLRKAVLRPRYEECARDLTSCLGLR